MCLCTYANKEFKKDIQFTTACKNGNESIK